MNKRQRKKKTDILCKDTKNALQIQCDAFLKKMENMTSEEFTEMLNSPSGREDHRKEYSDLEWNRAQPRGKPNYKVGDIIEFKVGGKGVITTVSEPHDGWASSYATSKREGLEYRKDTKTAWHLEGDFMKPTEEI